MKTPRRRTLKKQVAHLQAQVRASQVRASRQRAPHDEHQTRALRALVAAYAIQFGPMKVTIEAADQIATIADAAHYDPEGNLYAMPASGAAHPAPRSGDVGLLLLMAARHAMKERNHANAFAWAGACETLASTLDPVRAEVAGQEVAQALVFERRPFAPMTYQEEMERGVRALLPVMRPQGRALAVELLHRHVFIEGMA